MRWLPLIGIADVEAVVRADRNIELFDPVAIHVTEDEVLLSVGADLPAFVRGRHVLPARITEGLNRKRDRDQVFHFCCDAGAGGMMLHSGQPITMLLRVSFSLSRRAAISALNCSSVSATRLPRSMNM